MQHNYRNFYVPFLLSMHLALSFLYSLLSLPECLAVCLQREILWLLRLFLTSTEVFSCRSSCPALMHEDLLRRLWISAVGSCASIVGLVGVQTHTLTHHGRSTVGMGFKHEPLICIKPHVCLLRANTPPLPLTDSSLCFNVCAATRSDLQSSNHLCKTSWWSLMHTQVLTGTPGITGLRLGRDCTIYS